MTRLVVRLVLLGLLAAVTILPAFGVTSSTSVAAAASVTTPVADLCVWCDHPNLICIDGYHYAIDTESYPEEWDRAGGAHNGGQCFSGSCWTMHGECNLGEPTFGILQLESLRAAVAKGDIHELRRVMAAYPRAISYNATRGALQVTNCTGQVTSHLPIDLALRGHLIDAADPR